MYTAVVSDLHLTEAEPFDPKRPFWKRYKSEEFFFDKDFSEFLIHLSQKSEGAPVELILNGDIFDFDAVMQLPDEPFYHISWLEKQAGLFARPERSAFKMKVIARQHPTFFQSLRDFILRGNQVILVVGNHDIELHFQEVQKVILDILDLPPVFADRFVISPWFYISNQDTLVEHGNQYDPYCVFENPINPFVYGRNFKTILLPFGDMTCRYMVNGMGYFNPHVDSNYIMDLKGYVKFFFKYVMKTQPLLMWTWFWRSGATLFLVLYERFFYRTSSLGYNLEQRVEHIAKVSQATPSQVYQMKESSVQPATRNPVLLLQELWLDRALLMLVGVAGAFQLLLILRQVYELSFFWALFPLLLLAPFFVFYSKSVISQVSEYKEPDDVLLLNAAKVCDVERVIHGHIHDVRHEMRGAVEYLNSGTWSPAFTDVECREKIDTKTFIWIEPSSELVGRRASAQAFAGNISREVFGQGRRR